MEHKPIVKPETIGEISHPKIIEGSQEERRHVVFTENRQL
jgi:hypothetical protein